MPYQHGAVAISRGAVVPIRASDPVKAGAGTGAQPVSGLILDKSVTTSHRGYAGYSRKRSRLYKRMTELEYYAPDCLRSACFVTLTCAADERSETVRLGWHRCQAWLMRHGYRDYLVTSAVQEHRLATYGAAVLHYHVMILGHKTVPAAALRAVWGLGATKHETARNATHAIRYIACYQGQQGARLTWSRGLLARLPAGARPHSSCLRYMRECGDFAGGVIALPWGIREIVGHANMVYVESQGRVMPRYATSNHSLLWTCWRYFNDWQAYRAAMSRSIRGNNEFIWWFLRSGYGITRTRYPVALECESS